MSTSTLRNYVARLLPRLSKSGILEDLRMAHTTLTDAKDVYARALDKFGGKFRDPVLNDLSKNFASQARTGTGKSIIANIAGMLPDVLASIETLETIASGELDEVIATQGLNYKKATLIQMADALTFASRMTVKILKYCTRLELDDERLRNNLEPSTQTELDQYEEQKINESLGAYAAVMTALSTPKTLSDRLEKIPDILVTGTDFGILKNTVGKANLEPFDLSGTDSNLTWTPWYNSRLARVVAKHERAEEARSELQIVRIQLYQLENAQRGKDDAATQQQIKMLRLKSDRLTRDIEREER